MFQLGHNLVVGRRMKLSRDILLLAAGQALSGTVVALLTSVSSLAGAKLAPSEAFSTAPVTAGVCGSFLMIYPASTVMGRFGRRVGFSLKAGLGVLGGLLGATAVYLERFELLLIGAFLLGAFSAFSLYYRFAAIEAATSDEQRVQAVALITGAGVVGGIVGPLLGELSVAGAGHSLAGPFVALIGVCILIAASQHFLSADLGRAIDTSVVAAPKPVAYRASPDFIVASIICAIGMSAMTLTMNAGPLAISIHQPQAGSATLILQAHFVAMYLPSLFNPILTRRFGDRALIGWGLAAFLLMSILALVLPASTWLYLVPMVLSGVGWNFVFNGGTLMVASTYSQESRARAQGLKSLIVYGASFVASLSAGVLLARYNWRVVNLACVPIIALGAVLLLMPRAQARVSHP